MPNTWIIARIIVGFIFAYAGLSKLLESPENFAAALYHYALIPPAVVPAVSRVLPWFEWIFGVFFAAGYAYRISACVLAVLNLGFIVSLLGVFLAGQSAAFDCGCFGQAGLHLSRQQVFVMDLISMAVLVRLILLKQMPWSLDRLLHKVEMRLQSKSKKQLR